MIAYDLFENQNCPHCGGPAFSNLKLAEKKDACYSKVRSRYKVWPSAYASGALVQCRKKGADNWGNKSKGVTEALPPVAAAAAAVARQQAVAKGAAQAVGGATASNAFMSAADRLGAGQSGETNLSNIQAPESLEQGNAPKKLKKDGRGAKFRKQSKQQSVAEGGIPNLRKVMVPTVGQRVIADVSGYGRFGLDGTEPGVIVRIPSPRLIKVRIDKDGEIYDFTNNELYQQGVAEGKQKINWIKPNFDFEWHEVEEQSKMKQVPADVRQYYQKHFPNKDAWIKAVQNGKAVVVPPDHAYEIRNAPWDKASLQKVLAPTGHEGSIGPAKEKRVNDLFDKGQVEMPIILKTSQGLWLIGGKTRLGTANYIKGIPAKVWLVGGEQGVAEDSRSHEERLDQRNAVEQIALHNRQMDYFQQFVDWSGKEMKDIYNNMDNHQLAYELENLGMQIAGNWRNQKYYKPGDPKREQFYSLMKQWYDLYKEAERKFSKDQGVAEGSEKTFTVVYYSKKTDRTVTKPIKASSESELWDRLRAKKIDVISVEEQGVAEGNLRELAPNPGGGDGGGGDDGDDGFELPLDFKGQNVLVWPKNKKYSMGDTATPFPRGEQFTGKVYIMWDGPKIEAIFYLDPKDREDREAEYERVYGPQGRGYEDWLDHKWYDTTTPRYRFVTDWKLKPAKEPGGWPGIVDAWGQDMKAEVMNYPESFITEIIQKDGDGRHFVEPKQSVTEGYLNEFAPGDGNGEGRWYTDDQMIDMVGPDWAPEDDAGHLTLAQRLQDAQAWLDDQGYSVAVEDVQIDPDGGYRWKIYGEFYNPRFAKKDQGVAETSDYFRRREREEAIISGQKPARKKQPAQTSDYARRRAQEKKAEKGVAEMDDRRHVRYHQVYGDPGENPRASEYRGPWYLDVEGTILQDKNSQPQQFWSYNDAYQYAVNLTNYLRQHGQPLKYAIAITREPKSNSAKI